MRRADRLRAGFRHFRTDRIIAAETLDEKSGAAPAELRRRWQLLREAELRPALK